MRDSTFFRTFMANIFPIWAPWTFLTWKTWTAHCSVIYWKRHYVSPYGTARRHKDIIQHHHGYGGFKMRCLSSFKEQKTANAEDYPGSNQPEKLHPDLQIKIQRLLTSFWQIIIMNEAKNHQLHWGILDKFWISEAYSLLPTTVAGIE